MGLIARGIERRGLPTVFVGMMLDVLELIRAPRAAFLDLPLGHPFGRPGDREGQLAILWDVLALLASARESGTVSQLPQAWGEPFTYVPGQRRGAAADDEQQ
ncbi:MAG: hypothetical protein M0Z94_01940 [Dehalococcoidales bacterium]|nr:hypothetical protein [Dehalococcoidales bacterium]